MSGNVKSFVSARRLTVDWDKAAEKKLHAATPHIHNSNKGQSSISLSKPKSL